MSFNRDALAEAIAAHGPVARVVVAETRGSVPRGPGAAMLVWTGGQSGTIGGGALEWEAAARARAVLGTGRDRIDRLPLGPALGQCCGGAVTLWTEVWDADRLAGAGGPLVARGPGARPLEIDRLERRARGEGLLPVAGVVSGWLVEPVTVPARSLWIWGAGHVGRAIAAVVAPLPDFAVTLLDTAPARFPDAAPNVLHRVFAHPSDPLASVPAATEHLVLTYSHALDLEICHQLLTTGFTGAGVIGSATKWARFQGRLAALGHESGEIERIRCPIGRPELGKHPQAIALSVASTLLLDGLRGASAPRWEAEETG